MGKSANKRRKKGEARLNPTGIVDERTEAAIEEEEEAGQHEITQEKKILGQLADPDEDERAIATNTLASLIDARNPGAVQALIEAGVIQALIERLTDTSLVVQTSAAGALRNLIIAGDEDVPHTMLAADIMTALRMKVVQYINEEVADDARRSLICQFLEQGLALILSLCENSIAALASFARTKQLPVLLNCLNFDRFPFSVGVVAAQCINVMTDENEELANQLKKADGVRIVTAAADGDQRIASICAGILLNITVADERVNAIQTIAPQLIEAVSFNGGPALEALGDNIYLTEQGIEAAERLEWRNRMFACREALVVLANASCDPTGDADEGGQPSQEMIMFGGLPQAIVEALDPLTLIGMVLPKCQFAPPALHQMVGGDASLIELLVLYYAVQFRALSLLGNLVLCAPIEDVSQITPLWDSIWELGQTAARLDPIPGVPVAPWSQVFPAITKALLAVVRKISWVNPLAIAPAATQVQELVGLARGSENESVRGDIMTVLGIMGQSPAAVPLHEPLCQLFMDGLSDGSLWVVAEAINSLVDIFAEIPFTPDMIRALKLAQRQLKSRMDAERRELDRELVGIMEEMALPNLKAFIAYKEEQNGGR